MKVAPLPPDEAARLALLGALDRLDTAPEASFDRITRLAARLLRMPAARRLRPRQAALLQDLAALVSRELALRELALHAQGALLWRLEVAGDGAVRFTYACKGVAQMLGTSPQALYDDADLFLRRVHPDDLGALQALLRELPPQGSLQGRFRLAHAGRRSVAWCEARATAAARPGGGIAWSGFLTDVTEQVEQERRRRESERLWATTVLSAGVAHDFNNLLGSMTGLAEICRDQAEPGSRMHRNLQAIMDGGARAALLIRRLRDHARQSALVLQPMLLGPMATDMAPLLKMALPAGVALAVEVGAEEAVAADRSQLEQVLLNLVLNAGHAMKERGGAVRIVIDVRSAAHSPLKVRSTRLQVIDTGCGIAPEHLPRLFQPFFTTRAVGEGSGLGLASAHGIVTGHGGQIEVRSVQGQGSTFSVWLPCVPAAEAVAQATEG